MLALSIRRDQHRAAALRWSERILDEQIRVVTHRGVLFEIGNGLSQSADRGIGARVLADLTLSHRTEIALLDDASFGAALGLFTSRPDKEWGLVDCASFVVMRERGLTEALTADRHFEQAGFRALLLDAD